MGSILTNNSAMVALQTLSSINKGLGKVQSEVATGLKVGQAKDNAATFAISQVMRSDVKGFNAISETLSLGSSTVAVASSASKAIGETLNEIKGKIVSAQQDNVDRQAIQDEITALTNQVTSIVNAAQFNGLNLVDGSVEGGSINVLSSLDRANSGAVTSSNISVDAQNLSTTAGTALTAAAFADSTGAPGTLAASGGTVVIDTAAFQGGAGALASDNTAADLANDAALLAGDQVSFTIGDATTGQTTATYTIKEGDSMQAVVSGLNASFESNGLDANFALDLTTAEELTITNNSNADIAFSFEATRGTGALASLSSMDVTTANGAANALQDIEVAIGATIDAQAAFGTAENRIEIQGEFMSKLIDSFKSGIGTLVDSDLEEASARLQSLQVQQQLGTQALSIANQAPQSILSLLR